MSGVKLRFAKRIWPQVPVIPWNNAFKCTSADENNSNNI